MFSYEKRRHSLASFHDRNTRSTYLALEAVRVEDCSCDLDDPASDALPTPSTVLNMILIETLQCTLESTEPKMLNIYAQRPNSWT
jgi:hypothetical protein